MGAGVSVGAKPSYRVIEVVHPSEVILRPRRQHHSVTIGLGRRRVDPFTGHVDVLDPTGRGIPVFNRATGCA